MTTLPFYHNTIITLLWQCYNLRMRKRFITENGNFWTVQLNLKTIWNVHSDGFQNLWQTKRNQKFSLCAVLISCLGRRILQIAYLCQKLLNYIIHFWNFYKRGFNFFWLCFVKLIRFLTNDGSAKIKDFLSEF
jgi:hypothetical protein